MCINRMERFSLGPCLYANEWMFHFFLEGCFYKKQGLPGAHMWIWWKWINVMENYCADKVSCYTILPVAKEDISQINRYQSWEFLFSSIAICHPLDQICKHFNQFWWLNVQNTDQLLHMWNLCETCCAMVNTWLAHWSIINWYHQQITGKTLS